MESQDKVIIVTGANKGIGLALVKKLVQNYPKYKIILTAREASLGEKARKDILAKHPHAQDNVFMHKLDITDSKSLDNFFNEIKEKYHHIDILVNNAGASGFNNGGSDTYQAVVGTNYHATIDLTDKLLPLLSDDGRILMVSSELGMLSNQRSSMKQFLNKPLTLDQINNKLKELEKASLEGNMQDFGLYIPFYSTSKAFLNAYVRWVLVHKLKSKQSCFALTPGLCDTDLSRHRGGKTAEEGTKPALYLVGLNTEKAKELSGKFFSENAKLLDY